ncbi:hypothetical protein F4775DRAFT_375222 [Biscogniauxia sp. FL1348]|nr:hypothetical protein F4775DRAFT_375222 [Biscogniauxia sp. FL1348]
MEGEWPASVFALGRCKVVVVVVVVSSCPTGAPSAKPPRVPQSLFLEPSPSKTRLIASFTYQVSLRGARCV